MPTIGVPKALFYYKHPLMWDTFFKELGFEVETSGETNREILEDAVKLSENEACLSYKVFNGHISALVNKNPKLDYIFIPRYKSLRRRYKSCPKLFALAEVAKTIFSHIPAILNPEINFTKEKLDKTLYKFGCTLNKSRAKKATLSALCTLEKYRKDLEKQFFQKLKSKKPKIILISHPYNIHDSFINLNITKKLKDLGVEVITIDSVPYKEQTFYSGWDFMDEMIAQTKEIVTKDIRGAVQLATFNCGCDSILISLIEREFRKANIPYMSLIIDEHTGDAGMQTRLEAFVDTLGI